jgi:flagellar capping protein FliD
LYYEIPRTASVISLNYSIYGMLSKNNFIDISEEYSALLPAVKSFISKYNDPLKKFVIELF